MTQATVNVGNGAVRNLNPNAQQFSSSDFKNGTVLAGPTVPSDDSYADYNDNGTGSFLRQHQSHGYSNDPSSIDPLQHYQQSTYVLNNHAAMLDSMDHQQQPTILNPNHPLLHPQVHNQQAMPDDEQAHRPQVESDQLRQSLRKQLEYYFSKENLVHDKFLISMMDVEDYVPIETIAKFNLVQKLTHDIQLIIDVLKELPSVEVDAEEKKVRSSVEKRNRLTRKRCIIILRDVPFDALESEVSNLFVNEHCPIPAVDCEKVLETVGGSGCWYVTFNSEDDAQNAFLYLTRENVSIRGHKVLARMKARLWQNPSSVPSTNASTPVSPSMQVNSSSGGATSPLTPPQQSQPPPLPQQQQQQQPPPSIQSYPNAGFVPQQQPTAPPAQYATHLPQQQQQQQQQFNPQVHASMYMQATSNQNSLLGNLQQSANSYRHSMHPNIAPPQHVAAQYPTASQTHHPSSLDHNQVLQQQQQQQQQQMRLNYPQYATNPAFDRAAWAAAAHHQSLQSSQSALSFATAAQQSNMASYPSSIHAQSPFLATNHGVLQGNFLYMHSHGYQSPDGYSTMPYNSVNKPKARMARDPPGTSKPRNSAKPPGGRNSRHEGLHISNEHSNELLDYCQHSTPHSEGSSSPVSRADAAINRSNDPLATVVSNTSIQHVQAYPSTTVDPSASDHIDHYHPHPTNDILYNSIANSHHVPQPNPSENNPSHEQANEAQTLGKHPAPSSYATPASVDNAKANPLNYQPLEQRKSHPNTPEQHNPSSINENQQPLNKKSARPLANEPQQAGIRPLMQRENRATQNTSRPSSSQQQGRPQQQPQPQQPARLNASNTPNASTPLSVSIPKVSSATYYNQTSSPQSPNSNQKNQQQQQQQPIDTNGPRSYADMLKLKQAPQKQSESKTDGPSSSDLSPSNQPDSSSVPAAPPSLPSSSSNADSTLPRRNSSTSDHPQQQQQQQHPSPSHQQYNNSRGRGGRGGNYRYSNDRRPGANNGLNRGGRGGGPGRRPVNNTNNAGSNGPPQQPPPPPPYQARVSGGRGNGRYFDRPRGGGNYHNSNPTVHRFTSNTGNVEPQVH